MKLRTFASFSAMTLFATLGISVHTSAQKVKDQIITFDAGPNGTIPTGINPEGAITGWFYDPGGVLHGFVRAADGTVTAFDAGPAGPAGTGTAPIGINPAKVTTGAYLDAVGGFHGFVRNADGTITVFDAGPHVTNPTGINPRGEITGSYVDASFMGHGFVRSADGTITTFDAGLSATFPTGINPRGEITGYAFDMPTGSSHGFVRAADGTITTFPPQPSSINAGGEITGSAGRIGFLRNRDGKISTFSAFQTPSDTFTFTSPTSINSRGAIAGVYSVVFRVVHGFVRAADGTITTFDACPLGTSPTSINSRGAITGYCPDLNFVHGFLRNPDLHANDEDESDDSDN
jgi:hypothetical protein